MFKSIFNKFLRFRVAAVRRYGERKWTFNDSVMEINPAYTVSCSKEETGIFNDADNTAYLFELSNGTRFIAFVQSDFDTNVWSGNGILSDAGAQSNELTPPEAIQRVKDLLDQFNRLKYRV